MKMLLTSSLVLALGLTACAGPASFGRADANDDGRISRDEATQAQQLAAVFDYADANLDGYLSSAEFDSAQEVLRASSDSHQEGVGAGGGGGHSADGHQH